MGGLSIFMDVRWIMGYGWKLTNLGWKLIFVGGKDHHPNWESSPIISSRKYQFPSSHVPAFGGCNHEDSFCSIVLYSLTPYDEYIFPHLHYNWGLRFYLPFNTWSVKLMHPLTPHRTNTFYLHVLWILHKLNMFTQTHTYVRGTCMHTMY